MKSFEFQLCLSLSLVCGQVSAQEAPVRCPADPAAAFSQYETLERLNLVAFGFQGELSVKNQPINGTENSRQPSIRAGPAQNFKLNYQLVPGSLRESVANLVEITQAANVKPEVPLLLNNVLEKLKNTSKSLDKLSGVSAKKKLTEIPQNLKSHFSKNLYHVEYAGPRVINSRKAWVYKLQPRTTEGSFVGEFIIDAETCWPLKMEGYMTNVSMAKIDRFSVEFAEAGVGYYPSEIKLRIFRAGAGLIAFTAKDAEITFRFDQPPKTEATQPGLLIKYGIMKDSPLTQEHQHFAVSGSSR